MSAAELPRLLRGVGERRMTDLREHDAVHGPLGDLRSFEPERIVALVESAGLRGHGGAGFPTAVKMRAVAARRKPRVVVANGTEGEPASKKDRALLREVPHLVLDGAALAARAVGASEAIIALCEADDRGLESVAAAIAQRRDRGLREPDWQVVEAPDRYITGQESALVNLLSGGDGLPVFGARPFQRGVRGRPTLVQNVETLAHVALVGRHGPAWFRGVGTEAHPGSTLITAGGAVGAPGVYEIEHGMTLGELLDWVRAADPAAVLLGGYFGTWLATREAGRVRLDREHLAGLGASLGAGVIMVLPREACPVAETARVADWFADQSAEQCGPCVNGLDAISYTVASVAAGTGTGADLDDLERWGRELRGRGACQHPDGASRFVASALRTFAGEFADHARHGPCERCSHPPVLPVPAPAFA